MANLGKSVVWHKTLRFVVLVVVANLLLRYIDQQILNPRMEHGFRGAALSSVNKEEAGLAEEKSKQSIVSLNAFPGLHTKKRFALLLQRLIAEENRALQWQHRRLSHLDPRNASFSDRVWMQSLAYKYGIDCVDTCDSLSLRAPLQELVNKVPVAGLLLAAAVSSRFGVDISARRHRNLFVLWQPKAPPRYRAEGVYPWRSFMSWSDSVRAFVHFINTDPAFVKFRQARALHKSEAAQLQLLRDALLSAVPEKTAEWEQAAGDLLQQ